MINVVLCGGSGTRLWPVSRSLMPKQFVQLFQRESLFQRTIRLNSRVCTERVVVSNADQYFLARGQLEVMGASAAQQFVLEPVGRNTAPAIALACLQVDPDEVVLVTPSDHLVRDAQAYHRAVERAARLAADGELVTFGITPTSPETGYGYIQAEGENVLRFVEKPSVEKAKEYLAAGGFYWNSGIFCFRAGAYLTALEEHAPDIYHACCEAARRGERTRNSLRVGLEDMQAIRSDSIDYAVMEKAAHVKVVPADMGWSDLGSFDALHGELPRDESGNTTNEQLLAIDSRDNLVLGGSRKIATIELEGMMVVDTPDALLVAPRSAAQRVKEVVSALQAEGSDLHIVPQTVSRPWGSYTVLGSEGRHKIKRIVVKPGQRISLQKHFHRSEHWVVVSGTATVTVGDRNYIVRPNESTYINAGEAHRLENEGRIDLVIVEVQVGEYTGEDDIVRIEDDYQRTSQRPLPR